MRVNYFIVGVIIDSSNPDLFFTYINKFNKNNQINIDLGLFRMAFLQKSPEIALFYSNKTHYEILPEHLMKASAENIEIYFSSPSRPLFLAEPSIDYAIQYQNKEALTYVFEKISSTPNRSLASKKKLFNRALTNANITEDLKSHIEDLQKSLKRKNTDYQNLTKAFMKQDILKIERLINIYPEFINLKDYHGKYPIDHCKTPKMFAFCLKHGSANITIENMESFLNKSIYENDPESFKIIFEKLLTLKDQSKELFMKQIKASRPEFTKAIIEVLKESPNHNMEFLNQKSSDGRTPLMLACDNRITENSLKLIKTLINAGADVTLKDINNRNALALLNSNKEKHEQQNSTLPENFHLVMIELQANTIFAEANNPEIDGIQPQINEPNPLPNSPVPLDAPQFSAPSNSPSWQERVSNPNSSYSEIPDFLNNVTMSDAMSFPFPPPPPSFPRSSAPSRRMTWQEQVSELGSNSLEYDIRIYNYRDISEMATPPSPPKSPSGARGI